MRLLALALHDLPDHLADPALKRYLVHDTALIEERVVAPLALRTSSPEQRLAAGRRAYVRETKGVCGRGGGCGWRGGGGERYPLCYNLHGRVKRRDKMTRRTTYALVEGLALADEDDVALDEVCIQCLNSC